jgi:hypothetical protein
MPGPLAVLSVGVECDVGDAKSEPTCRLPSHRQTALVIADDLLGTPPVEPRQVGAVQGDVIQFIGESDSVACRFHLRQSLLDRALDGFGQGLAGKAGEPFRVSASLMFSGMAVSR